MAGHCAQAGRSGAARRGCLKGLAGARRRRPARSPGPGASGKGRGDRLEAESWSRRPVAGWDPARKGSAIALSTRTKSERAGLNAQEAQFQASFWIDMAVNARS